MIRLALLRHGHTAWNRAGRIQGRSDVPLDQDARVSLGNLGLPSPWEEADLVASPLGRATETARLVAKREATTEPALIEMNWGDWEGQYGAELADRPGSGYLPIEHWGWSYRPPGGESPDEIRARLSPWLATLKRDTVAVTHIGVMRVLLAMAHGWDFSGPAPFRIKRNRLYVITLGSSLGAETDAPIRLVSQDAL
ncbi:histidine phosphatase family protein [Thalassococcus sp. S3]|uniref:histidine phosphatase family protein n=1 Tax=Thalassococcus sp. S3 TaxID=2017482 RepID=UPI0010241829|nr:histidine phosphatase family protein [Thalassococcus sp. S3]QBF30669.1 phosphoglycerate mutase [Thalassococcus sp. S3]